MSDEPGAAEAARPGRRPSRRRLAVGGVVVGLVLVLAAGAGLVVFRYLPALDEARALRADLEAMVERVQDAGLGIDASTVADLRDDLEVSRARLGDLQGLVADDPVIAVVRMLPPTAASVRGADAVLEASDRLLDGVEEGLVIADRFVAIREAQATDPGGRSALAELVELIATTRPQAVAAVAAVAAARAALEAVPDGAIDQVARMRDAMAERIDRYQPLLDAYVDASDRLPAILGWDGPRRYLVLTQDPAELRPSGGLIGSYGILGFDRGRLVEQRFQGVGELDWPWDFPWITPPQEMADYLLGPDQPWQLADAGWSPDFPTSAQTALRLYTNESGDARIDGVLGITTYTIDELLRVTGPVTVPEYEVTIASGETTLKVLQQTRASPPGEDRKAFLPLFADRLFEALFAVPSGRWAELAGTVRTLHGGHMVLAWFSVPADQALAAETGFDGAVRQDQGDYVYPVDSNVAPATKLNAWTTRTIDHEVQIDAVGNARHVLTLTWDNRVATDEGATYRAMTNVGGPTLGLYARLLVPERSRLESVEGSGPLPVTRPSVVESEAGRTVFGAYLRIPPGEGALGWTWTSPYAADADETGGTYRLTIQQQPGLQPGAVTVSIRVPEGYRITAASRELTVSGDAATLRGQFDGDLVVGLRYAPTTLP